MKGSEMMNQLLGEQNYKRLKQSRLELVEAAMKAGADEAKDYLKEADYRDLLLITQISPDEDYLYPQLWEISTWDMSATLDEYPEKMHRYIEHGFVQHIRSVVALMESQEAMGNSANLIAQMEEELEGSGGES